MKRQNAVPPSLGTIPPPIGSVRGYEVGVWFVPALFDVWRNFSASTSLLSQNAGQGRPHQIRSLLRLACLFYCWSVRAEASICAADRAAVTTSRIALVTTSGW